MNFKITEENKETLELAATMSGLSMTSILVRGAIAEAKRVLKDLEKGK